ncbi:MAG: hypothetical protein FJ276_22805, partial [Planctomycetes bacterium]|nr:hypothetical protein [Planctomycetota bacterium]
AEVTITLPSPLEPDDYPEIIQDSEQNRMQVLGNDPFWPGYGGARRITAVTAGSQGGAIAVIDDGRAIAYTPPAGFAGWDDFRYVVDGRYEAAVSVQVHRPVRDDAFDVDAGSTRLPLMLTENDTFSYYANSLITRDVIERVTSVGAPTRGGTATLMADGQGVFYSAPEGFEGEETFEYVADGKHAATVTVRVTRPVRDDSFSRVSQGTVNNVLDVLRNDFLGNGYTGLRLITGVSETAEGGTIAIAPGGRSLRYTPPADFRGTDSFSYVVDGHYEANVGVRVASPVEPDYFSLCPISSSGDFQLDVLANDQFGAYYPGPARITDVGDTENGGRVAVAADGKSLRFVPQHGGSDSFSYVVDGQYEATVHVGMRSYLNPDSLVADQNSRQVRLAPLENDFSDQYWMTWQCGAYPGHRRITSVGPTDHGGTVSIEDGTWLRYTPPVDFVGTDHFVYVVDGVMQADVNVHVIRRVRDDAYRVDPNSADNRLFVLVNDLFGADYSGAGRITGVTRTAAGGTVTIAGDGGSIAYTPPANFEGRDAWTYTVDGALKAEVTVSVVESVRDTWRQFSSLEDFQQFLLEDALNRYADLFGKDAVGWWYETDGMRVMSTAGGAEQSSHSQTNVQVAGVDEGDIIETDGEALYILTNGELVIADAWPAAEMSVRSRTGIEGIPIAEYLHGKRLTVISRTPSDFWPMPVDADRRLSLIVWPPVPRRNETWVTVFDVSDPNAPRVVQKTLLDGYYVESRRIDDFVFLVLRNDRMQLPGPKRLPVDDTDSVGDTWGTSSARGVYVYESREQYVARMKSEMGQVIEELLPRFAAYGPDGELARSGLLHTPEDLFRPPPAGDNNLISVVSLNMSNNEPGISNSAGVLAADGEKVYGSLENLYVFSNQYTSEDGVLTRILKFNWDAQTGDIRFAATGKVAGSMLNQFSADEFDDHLRIATTISNAYSGNYSRRAENVLFVLRDDAGVLEFVGGLKNLALNETIHSVRFFGDRAFLTTFRDIDPLFGLDLSDPARPISVGHLTMPGFNSYMQVIDGHFILAVGRNSPVGANGPTHVALFDVHDLSRPRLWDQYTFERFSTSEAETDHHAFGWYAAHQLLAVPSARSYWKRVDEDGDGYHETREHVTDDALFLFRIDTSVNQPRAGAIRVHGQIDHDSRVRRSAFIRDVLYSVADNSAIAVDINNPARQFAELRYDPPEEPGSSGNVADMRGAETIAAKMAARAKNHLAGTEGISDSQIICAAVETARWATDALRTDADARSADAVPGFRIVLDLDGAKYLYHTDQDERIVLVDEAFDYQPPSVQWHNGALPNDVNGDSYITPMDALILINELNHRGARRLVPDQVARIVHHRPGHFLDVNGDGCLYPLDALLVISHLNGVSRGGPTGEGEGGGPVLSVVDAPAGETGGRSDAEPEAALAEPWPVESVAHVPVCDDLIGMIARDVASRTQVDDDRDIPAELTESLVPLELFAL